MDAFAFGYLHLHLHQHLNLRLHLHLNLHLHPTRPCLALLAWLPCWTALRSRSHPPLPLDSPALQCTARSRGSSACRTGLPGGARPLLDPAGR